MTSRKMALMRQKFLSCSNTCKLYQRFPGTCWNYHVDTAQLCSFIHRITNITKLDSKMYQETSRLSTRTAPGCNLQLRCWTNMTLKCKMETPQQKAVGDSRRSFLFTFLTFRRAHETPVRTAPLKHAVSCLRMAQIDFSSAEGLPALSYRCPTNRSRCQEQGLARRESRFLGPFSDCCSQDAFLLSDTFAACQ